MAEGKGTPTPKQEKDARQRKPWTHRKVWGKQLWDWMQLGLQLLGVLLIPIVIALVGWRVASDLDARQRDAEELRAQDLALQGYLDTMSTLVLKDLGDNRVRAVMRARTLTALERLNPNRKSEVMRFLVEADLARGPGKSKPVVSLYGADLEGASMNGAKLKGANLKAANLIDTHGYKANLSDANLFHAGLVDADLTGADLTGAKGITNERLQQSGAILKGATMPTARSTRSGSKTRKAVGETNPAPSYCTTNFREIRLAEVPSMKYP